MKTQSNRLTFSQQFFIATMLFGLFFGAGNLIFPIFLGSQAGRNVWPAIVGLLITGVGIPLLGVAAQGISRSNGLQEMAGRVSPRYSIFFTCALYLTIGPFFAIPRCASTSFTVGIEPLLGENVNATVLLAAFSCVFFAAVLFFSLRPGKILTWVGKPAPPIPVQPASRMMSMISWEVSASAFSRGLQSGLRVFWKSFSITTESVGTPPVPGRGSTATTVPETLAWMGAPRPAVAPII